LVVFFDGSHEYNKRRIMRNSIVVVLTLLILCCVGCPPSLGQPSNPSEYQVKAAFLYNLTKFIEWPQGVLDDPAAPFNIGVLGESPMYAAVSAISENTIKDHKLNIKHLTPESDLENCQILFIDRTVNEVDKILYRLNGQKTLIVGEMQDFNQIGGLVNFIIINNRIGFEINQKRAEQAGFTISSKLLALARITPDGK
jgi:hypothetical protein